MCVQGCLYFRFFIKLIFNLLKINCLCSILSIFPVRDSLSLQGWGLFLSNNFGVSFQVIIVSGSLL
jgi:hypothetical protein